MYRLTIQGRLASLNDYVKACRSNPHAGNKFKKEQETIITWYIIQDLRKVNIDKPVRLHFRWYEPNRKRDVDNIASAKKYILDALVSNEVIPNDNQKYVKGFTDEFYIDTKNPRVEVDIEEVEQ